MYENTDKTAKTGVDKNINIEKSIGDQPAPQNEPIADREILYWLADKPVSQYEDRTREEQAKKLWMSELLKNGWTERGD